MASYLRRAELSQALDALGATPLTIVAGGTDFYPARVGRALDDDVLDITDIAALTRVTCGGAPVTVWPGGGITFFVDVMRMPENAFGYVPTPALVAPIEFTLRLDDFEALGGHIASVKRLDDVVAAERDHLRLTA